MVGPLFVLVVASLGVIPLALYIFVQWFHRTVNNGVWFLFNIHVVMIEFIAMWPPYPRYYRMDRENISTIAVNDGTRIFYWKYGTGDRVLFWLHGNAQNIGEDLIFRMVADKLGVTVIVPEYHGYCPDTYHTKRATFHETYKKCTQVYMHVTRELRIPESNITIIGQSLGTGFATKMANDQRFHANKIILISPFLSLMSVVHTLFAAAFPFFDQLKNYNEVRTIRQPVMIIHGNADTLINITHGLELFKTLPHSAGNEFLELRGAGHNGIFMSEMTEEMFQKMKRFIYSP